MMGGITMFAQSDFDLSQRWFNEAIYNPAATGNSFTTSVFLQLRKQWLGVEGSPTTGVVSGDIYLNNIYSGIGFSVAGDKLGLINTYNARAAYAYYIPMGKASALSFGLSASLLSRGRNTNNVEIIDLGDPYIYMGNESSLSPDFDFGIEYRGPFKLGATVRHLIGLNSTNAFPAHSRNLWAYASTRFNAGFFTSIEPTISFVYRDKLSRFEVGSLFYFMRTDGQNTYNDKFWIGAMYRNSNEFSLLLGAQIAPQLRLGYSLDYAIGKLGNLSRWGTHEVFLAWQFNRVFYKETRNCPAYRRIGGEGRRSKKREVDLRKEFQ